MSANGIIIIVCQFTEIINFVVVLGHISPVEFSLNFSVKMETNFSVKMETM